MMNRAKPSRNLLTFSALTVGLLLLPSIRAGHPRSISIYPSALTYNIGYINSPEFLPFQLDLLERIEEIAKEVDNVTVSFNKKLLQLQYNANLPLLDADCHPGDTVVIEAMEHDCGVLDFIAGDYWPNADRFQIVDFTQPWLPTSVAAAKFIEKRNNPNLDVTTFQEAILLNLGICAFEGAATPGLILKRYPDAKIVPCGDFSDGDDGCITKLKREECSLWVGDELSLRHRQTQDPSLAMTGESLERSYLAWPFRRNMDPTKAFLLRKWLYTAISNQVIADLYFEHFEKKLCPIGRAGKDCELPCDPDHGMANARGKCVCDSTRWTGDDCSIEVPEDLNLIPYALKAIAFAMMTLNILIIAACAVWLYWHRHSPQVQVSQPSFLLLVLLGCLISSSTILAMAQEDEGDGPVTACMAIPWLYSLGFCVTFGTLFAKILKVYRLFTQECARPLSSSVTSSFSSTGRNQVPVQDTLSYIALTLLLDVVILILWTVADPLEWERVVLREDVFGVSLESQGYCTSENWVVFGSLIGALHLGLLATACYMCYAARNLPTQFSEHKYVSIAIFSNLQIFVVGVPVLVIVGGDPEISFFVRSVIVWINDLAVVTIIFGNLMCSVHLPEKGRMYSMGNGGSIKPKLIVTKNCQKDMSSPRNLKKPNPAEDESVSESVAEELPTFPVTPHARKLPEVSSLSMGSSVSGWAHRPKSVSFSDDIAVSEIPSLDPEAPGFERFSVEPIQGAPSQPRRQSVDGLMLKPVRIPSTNEALNQEEDASLTNSISHRPPPIHRRYSLDSSFTRLGQCLRSDSIWSTDPIETKMNASVRNSTCSNAAQPTRLPSEFIEEESESKDGCGLLYAFIPGSLVHAAPRLPARPPSPAPLDSGKARHSGFTTLNDSNDANIKKPERIASAAGLDDDSSADDDEQVEMPNLSPVTSFGSRGSSVHEKEQVQGPPSKPTRFLSSASDVDGLLDDSCLSTDHTHDPSESTSTSPPSWLGNPREKLLYALDFDT